MRRSRAVNALIVLSLVATSGVAAQAPAAGAPPPGSSSVSAPELASGSGSVNGAAAEVLARAKAASGGAAWDAIFSRHTRGKLHAGGLDGTGEAIEDVRTGRYVERYTLGPASGAEGFDGKMAWSQDASGQPRPEESDDARLGAVDEAYRRALAFWYPARWPATIHSLGRRQDGGRSFDVLGITPRGGRPFELWVDAATGLFDRTVEAGGRETRTTFFSEYRLADGVRLPFAQRSTNGDTKYDQTFTVASVLHNQEVSAAAFAMPGAPAADFALAAGATSVTVPFELLNNHIYVEVKLDGKGPFRVLCDTGGANILTPEAAHALGLQPQGALQGRGVGDKSEDVGLVKVATLELGGATLRNQLFAVFPLRELAGAEGVAESGLVGYEVFKRFVVRVDYERRTLTLTLPAAFAYHGGGTVVPFKFNEHIPQVEGAIDGIAGAFDIDTGSRASLDLLAPFVEEHALRARYAPRFEGVAGWGVGGPARAQFARAGSLRLGGVEIARPVVELTLQTKGAFAAKYVAGNVGGALLRLFNVTFDYSRQQLIFERRADSAQPIPFDRAGLWLNLAEAPPGVSGPPGFEVIDSYAGGPAAEAGLRQGDLVVAVDGKTPADLPLPAVRERLRTDPPGTRVTFTVDRAGKRSDLVVVLRDLV
jgi:hypothetical protein